MFRRINRPDLTLLITYEIFEYHKMTMYQMFPLKKHKMFIYKKLAKMYILSENTNSLILFC